MNNKLFLGIILIFTIIYQIFLPTVEGVCNFNDNSEIISDRNRSLGSSGAPIKNRSKESCQQSGIYSNNTKLEEVKLKLTELENIAAKVSKSVMQNRNNQSKNLAAAMRLGGSEEDGGEQCEKHPESCEDQKPYPKISKSRVEKAMNR